MEITLNIGTWMVPAGVTLLALIVGTITATRADNGQWGCDIVALIWLVGCVTATITAWIAWAAILFLV